jgi:hypothetical protein
MIRRHVNGARISIVLARNAEPAARTHIEWAGFRLGGGPRGPLDALTVIGAPHVQRHARLRAAMTAAEALPLRVSATRRRLLLTVPPEASIAMLEALHGEFVEYAAEVRCSA